MWLSSRQTRVIGLVPALVVVLGAGEARPEVPGGGADAGAATVAGRPHAPSVRSAFDRAVAAQRVGQHQQAARLFEELARSAPDDLLADEALSRAARLYEQRLRDPQRALELYQEVLRRYPNRRASRRAQVRSAYLQQALATGPGAVTEYHDILQGFVSRPKDESVARMERLLARHPRFAFAGQAAYWIGSVYLQERRYDEAMTAFVRVEQAYPGSTWARRARKARADILAERGDLAAAQRLYESLAASGDPRLARAAMEAASHARADTFRRRAAAASTGVTLVGLVLLALGARVWRQPRRLLRVPLEVLLYLPVAGVLVVVAWRVSPAVGRALLEIALVTAVAVHLLVCYLRLLVARDADPAAVSGRRPRDDEGTARPGGRSVRWGRRGVALALGLMLLVGAASYGAVYRTGLWRYVKDTVAYGPEG